MTGTEAPALSGRHAFSHRRENARLSALHRGDFWLPARAPRCSGFPPVSCGNLIRRIGSYGPEDRVLGPPQARLQPQPHPPDSHGLAPPYGIASRKLPSWARLGRYINDLHDAVNENLTQCSHSRIAGIDTIRYVG